MALNQNNLALSVRNRGHGLYFLSTTIGVTFHCNFVANCVICVGGVECPSKYFIETIIVIVSVAVSVRQWVNPHNKLRVCTQPTEVVLVVGGGNW